MAGEGLERRATWWPCGAGLSGGACCGWSHRSFSPAPALHTHLGFLHRRGTGGDRSPGRAAPGPPRAPSPVQETLPARRSRPQVAASPGAESDRAGGSSSSCRPGAQRGAPTAERRESRGRGPPPPRGRGAGRAGAGERPGRRALRSIVAARPPARTPRPRCRGQARQRPPSAGPGSVTRAASAINNPQPAPGAPPVTPDPRGGAAGETMTRCTRQPSC